MMYSLAPVNDFSVPIRVDDVSMYKVQPVEGGGTKQQRRMSSHKPNKAGKVLSVSSVEELEARQDKVLERLNELKSQLSSYKVSLGLAPIPTHFEVKKNNVVVCAHPSHPPYGLVLIYNQLKTLGLVVHATCHYHSSITEPVSEQVQDFFPYSQENVSKSDADLILTVIWKNGGDRDPYTVTDPIKKSVIKGEVNIIRLITRSYHSIWSYENESDSVFSESTLDKIHKELIWKNTGNPEEAAISLFKSLEHRLTPASAFYSGNPIPGPVDILLWSFITSEHGKLPYPVTSNKHWLNSCNKICALAFTREKRKSVSRRHSSHRFSRRKSSTRK